MVAELCSATQQFTPYVSCFRAHGRTLGLVPVAWDPRSRTLGLGPVVLRGSSSVVAEPCSTPHQPKNLFGTSPEGIPRGASSMILCLLEIGLHTRTCCLGLATKESQCVTFLGTATGRGLPPGPNPEPKHTILCLWSRTRSPCWRNLCSAICFMVAELCSATLLVGCCVGHWSMVSDTRSRTRVVAVSDSCSRTRDLPICLHPGSAAIAV
jgi:hypothetical protein